MLRGLDKKRLAQGFTFNLCSKAVRRQGEKATQGNESQRGRDEKLSSLFEIFEIFGNGFDATQEKQLLKSTTVHTASKAGSLTSLTGSLTGSLGRPCMRYVLRKPRWASRARVRVTVSFHGAPGV